MSADERALLAAIAAAPDDDLPRLAYADWLDEHDQADRAEFIRLECEQARIHDDPVVGPNEWENPRFWEINRRISELYERHKKEWFADLLRVCPGETNTRRGFPYHIAVSARQFIDHGDAIFKAAPTIEDVFLDRLGRNTEALAKCRALRHVRDLTFFETPFRAREAELLFASPYLGNLRTFEVPFTDTQMGPRGAAAIARCRSLTRLEGLDLHNHAIYDEGVWALLGAKRLATLRNLCLSNNGLTDRAAEALARAEHLDRLTSLSLSMNHISWWGTRILAMVAGHLSNLEDFNLGWNPITGGGVGHLVGAPFAGRLRKLNVGNCSLDDGGAAVLLSAGGFTALEELYLSMNGVDEQAFRALAANPGFARLRTLSLARCGITEFTAEHLGRVGTLPALRSLDLDNNPLGPDGIRALLAGPLVRTVSDLDLRETGLTDDGAVALAASSAVANLLSLDLAGNRITARGALALAASPHLDRLKYLNLMDSRISKKGMDALVRRFGEGACTF